MSKQCPNCAAACLDDDVFCGNCGSSFQQATGQPVRSRRRPAPAAAGSPVNEIAKVIMRYIGFILIAMTIFTLVMCIMNFTAGFEVEVTASGDFGGEELSDTQTMKLSEVYEAEKFIPLTISGLAFGLLHGILTVMAVLMIIKIFRGNRKIRRQLNRYSLVGLIGSVVYLILFWITGTQSETAYGITVKATVAPHFTVWLSILLFALLYALNFLAKKKRTRR